MYNPNNQLFHIQKEYVQLLGLIEEAEGEITDQIDKALQFTEDRLRKEGANVAFAIKTLEHWGEDLEREIERLTSLQRKANKGIDLLSNRLKSAMEQFGIERITNTYVTISFRKSEAVEITDEAMVPLSYKDQPPLKVSKTRIKEDMKKGVVIPGAELVQRRNLQIK